MSKKKNELFKKVMQENAVKSLNDPKEIEYAMKKLDELGDNGFLEMSVNKIVRDAKFLTKIMSAQENIINLITSCLGAMEDARPSLFKERLCDLTDGIKFNVGGSTNIDETDEVGTIIKCAFNDILWDMHKQSAKAMRNIATGADCIDMLVNCPEEQLEEMAKKFAKEKHVDMPDDVKEEIKQATRELKRGGKTYDA
jgi:hypothetical protein